MALLPDIIAHPVRRFAAAVLLGTALFASGCSTIDSYLPTARSFGVYKLDINQGNYLTQDQVDKLKVGQTKQQVRMILGTPLVTSAFRDNRWDYVYEFQRQGRMTEHRQFTVFFAEDRLARWEGDELPTSAAAQNRSAAAKSLKVEPDEESGLARWFHKVFGRS